MKDSESEYSSIVDPIRVKSVSIQTHYVDNISDMTPNEFLVRCAAFCAVMRENVDFVILQMICWLPAFLMTYVNEHCYWYAVMN